MLVTAAFIGPGTVTTASIAGAQFGFALLWALAFQCWRPSCWTGDGGAAGAGDEAGLSQALRSAHRDRWLGSASVILVIAAVGIGNAAYQTGNITGAALGLQSISGIDLGWWALLVGARRCAAGNRCLCPDRKLLISWYC